MTLGVPRGPLAAPGRTPSFPARGRACGTGLLGGMPASVPVEEEEEEFPSEDIPVCLFSNKKMVYRRKTYRRRKTYGRRRVYGAKRSASRRRGPNIGRMYGIANSLQADPYASGGVARMAIAREMANARWINTMNKWDDAGIRLKQDGRYTNIQDRDMTRLMSGKFLSRGPAADVHRLGPWGRQQQASQEIRASSSSSSSPSGSGAYVFLITDSYWDTSCARCLTWCSCFALIQER